MEKLSSKRIPAAVEALVQSYRLEAKENFRLSQKYKNEADKADGNERKLLLEVMNAYSQEMNNNNNCAVSLLLEHNIYTENGREYIDLHGLRAEEVASCLDIFLDKQIDRFRQTVRYNELLPKCLYVITGKGIHNINGKPVVKPRAIKHVTEKRKLRRYEEFGNAGCSIVEIYSRSPLSSELEARSRFRDQMKQYATLGSVATRTKR